MDKLCAVLKYNVDGVEKMIWLLVRLLKYSMIVLGITLQNIHNRAQ